jgi:uncharacterized membrane protein YhaH (DUF805 family)
MPVKNTTKKVASTASKARKVAPKAVAAKSSKPAVKVVKETPKVVQHKAVKAQDDVMSPLVMIKLWFEGWKNTFVLRGRTSRFELWNFLLLNSILAVIVQLKCSYILSSRFLREATKQGYSLDKIDSYVGYAEIGFYTVILLQLFPLGSMLIRRMHDLGRLAWKKCLEPVFWSMFVISFLTLTIDELVDSDYVNTIILIQICFVTTLYGFLFYSLKFLIMTLFYPGDRTINAYGEGKYNTPQHEEWALNLCCFWGLFVFTVLVLYLVMAII